MAIAPIENATIARLQDYSAIRHNEENKAAMVQSQIGQDQQKTEAEKPHVVLSSEETLWQNHNPDPREKGNNGYAGDGGLNRKSGKVVEKVVLKNQPSTGFDMKI